MTLPRNIPARVETKPGETKVTVDFRGCARPMSVERDGAVNAKDNPPTTDDGAGDRDPTDRQPAANHGVLRNHPFGSDRPLQITREEKLEAALRIIAESKDETITRWGVIYTPAGLAAKVLKETEEESKAMDELQGRGELPSG